MERARWVDAQWEARDFIQFSQAPPWTQMGEAEVPSS